MSDEDWWYKNQIVKERKRGKSFRVVITFSGKRETERKREEEEWGS